MKYEKTSLHEIASDPNALKTARSEPIQVETPVRQSMDFIRSLALDIPVQNYIETPKDPNMNIEKILETQLEVEARKQDPIDHVSFDIPTLIRVFELVREGIKSDVELHNLVERIVAAKDRGVLTMNDYETIAGRNPQGTTQDHEPMSPVDQQSENVDLLKKLAGIR